MWIWRRSPKIQKISSSSLWLNQIVPNGRWFWFVSGVARPIVVTYTHTHTHDPNFTFYIIWYEETRTCTRYENRYQTLNYDYQSRRSRNGNILNIYFTVYVHIFVCFELLTVIQNGMTEMEFWQLFGVQTFKSKTEHSQTPKCLYCVCVCLVSHSAYKKS